MLWLGLNAFQRAGFSAILLTLAIVIGCLVYWNAQPEYRPLFSGLAAEDAFAITSKLQSLGKEYRLASNGTTVLVPADQIKDIKPAMTIVGGRIVYDSAAQTSVASR